MPKQFLVSVEDNKTKLSTMPAKQVEPASTPAKIWTTKQLFTEKPPIKVASKHVKAKYANSHHLVWSDSSSR